MNEFVDTLVSQVELYLNVRPVESGGFSARGRIKIGRFDPSAEPISMQCDVYGMTQALAISQALDAIARALHDTRWCRDDYFEAVEKRKAEQRRKEEGTQ